MALTITTDLTVITNGNDGTWSDVGGGAGSASEPDYFIQGTGCRSRAVSGASASRGMTVDIGAGNELDFSVAGANEDELLYFWIQDYTPNLTDSTAAAPGLTIRIAEGATNGSDYAEWDIIYSNLLAPPGTEFFRVYVLDPRAPPTRTSGTWDYNNCRHFGAVLDTNASAKGNNLGIDRICHGRGEIRVTGTSDDETSGFQEMVAENWDTINDSVAIGSNSTARNGIFDVKGSTVFIKGMLVIGDDSGTLATDFQAQDTKFEWLETYYVQATNRIFTTVGYDDNQNFVGRDSNGNPYYGMKFVGNATGATNVTIGALVGTDQGRSGASFTGTEKTPTEIFTDANVNSVGLYGCNFDTIRSIDFSNLSSTDVFFGGSTIGCGSVDIGPVKTRNVNFITGTGGAYTFIENFLHFSTVLNTNLATTNPTTDWTLVQGTAGSMVMPANDSGYIEAVGDSDSTEAVVLDDDKVGSDNHYAEVIVFAPSGGAGHSPMGPIIASHITNADYFWAEVDIPNDHFELFRVDAGVDTSIAGSGAAGDFTMDEDEEYVVLLRRNGTTIEAFISGVSVADGQHTLKLSATDSNHTGVNQRLPGIRCDEKTAQTGVTGDRIRITEFGCGPITDNLGQIVLPTTANNDVSDVNLINCRRGLTYKNTGTYSHPSVNLSGNLVDAHNDSGGAVTGNFTSASAAQNVENLGASTSTFTANVGVTFANLKDNTEVRVYAAGTKTELAGIENATAGSPDARTFTATIAAATSVDYTLVNEQYEIIRVEGFTWPSSDQTIVVQQRFDRNQNI
jgi:hypothetical protein